jgi:hypothetical protein
MVYSSQPEKHGYHLFARTLEEHHQNLKQRVDSSNLRTYAINVNLKFWSGGSGSTCIMR